MNYDSIKVFTCTIHSPIHPHFICSEFRLMPMPILYFYICSSPFSSSGVSSFTFLLLLLLITNPCCLFSWLGYICSRCCVCTTLSSYPKNVLIPNMCCMHKYFAILVVVVHNMCMKKAKVTVGFFFCCTSFYTHTHNKYVRYKKWTYYFILTASSEQYTCDIGCVCNAMLMWREVWNSNTP